MWHKQIRSGMTCGRMRAFCTRNLCFGGVALPQRNRSRARLLPRPTPVKVHDGFLRREPTHRLVSDCESNVAKSACTYVCACVFVGACGHVWLLITVIILCRLLKAAAFEHAAAGRNEPAAGPADPST
jgi:hypothetical protein